MFMKLMIAMNESNAVGSGIDFETSEKFLEMICFIDYGGWRGDKAIDA